MSMRGLGWRVVLRPTPQSWEVPTMQQFPTRVKVGFDVHAAQTHVAVLDPAGGELWTRRLQGPPEVALELLASLAPGATAVYEAGPTGFGLARAAAERGLDLRVVSPGSCRAIRAIASRPTDATRSGWRGCSPRVSFRSAGCPPRARSGSAISSARARTYAAT